MPRALNEGSFSNAEGRGPWVGVHCTPRTHSAESLTTVCLQWAGSRSLCPFSVGSHHLRCLAVRPGWGTTAALSCQLPTLSWLQGELVWLPSRLLSPLSCWTVASATSPPPPPFSLISICQQLVEGQTDTFLPVPVSSSGSGLTHLPDSLPSTVSPIP